MTNLGKCLMFFLKYSAEMERLYESEEPKKTDLNGLPDPDRNLDRIRLVGDTGCREAADLLEVCAAVIENHFRAISTLERVRNNLEMNWELKFRVAPQAGGDKRFEVGVVIRVDRKALIPWVWRRGGRRAEDEMASILGLQTRIATPDDWASGSLMLAEIEIPIPESLEQPVACEPLITEVQKAFASFTAKKVDRIAAIANARGEE